MKKIRIPVIILTVLSGLYVLLRELSLLINVVQYFIDLSRYGYDGWITIYELLNYALPMVMLLFIPVLSIAILKWKPLCLAIVPTWVYLLCAHFNSLFVIIYNSTRGMGGTNWINILLFVLFYLLSFACLILSVITVILANPFKKERLLADGEIPQKPVKPIKPAPTRIVPRALDEIEKAKRLLDSGAITQEEFERVKKQYL